MPGGRFRGFRGKISFVHGNVLVVAVTIGFWSFGMRMTQSYASLYILALGATPFILGVISAASTFVLAFMRVPGGYIADRWGRKKVIYSLTFFVALTYFIYAFAVDWKWILIAAILSSLSLLYQPALQAIIADSLPPESRGVGYSVIRLVPTIVGIPGSIIALILVGKMGLVPGMRIAYSVAATMGILAALFRWLFLKETLTKHEDFEANSFGEVSREIFSKLFEAMRKVRKEFLVALFVYGVFSFASAVILSGRGAGEVAGAGLWMVYAADVLKLSEVDWGWVVTFGRIITAILIVPLGMLVDKLGRKNSFLIFLLMASISTYLFIYPANIYMVFVAYSIYMTARFGLMTAYQSIRADLIPQEIRGRVIGGSELIISFISVPASILGGYLYTYLSPQIPFTIFMLITLICAAITLILLKEPKVREQ